MTQEAGVAAGARIIVRDEEWLVRAVDDTEHDGFRIEVTGMSELVRGQEATFLTALDKYEVLDPEQTVLVRDTSSKFVDSRLFLEALLRKTPLPQSVRGLAMSDKFMLTPMPYQNKPAQVALQGLQPRLLIADVVGLGKTLEIGKTLAELIRRGMGEKILVVTPQQVLEQFQRELWTRFSIPLIRLDSVGIQRIQRDIPAGRNPFTHFKRVIISIDTLKNVDQYKHHLDNTEWDAVVIDESHNVIGATSLRSKLAKLLARQTNALILASATPHNGKRESFADLINLLDPTAIVNPKEYTGAQFQHLYVRRTKVSPDVKDYIQGQWAERGDVQSIHCQASPAEEKVFAELADTWFSPQSPVASGINGKLFTYNLLKAFLSSAPALSDTVANRIRNVAKKANPVELNALRRLKELADEITDEDASKLTALAAQLKGIGVQPGGMVRAVVFSERVSTLKWLGEKLPKLLGFSAAEAKKAVAVMHGGVPDTEEQQVFKDFGQAKADIRLLITGDIASEGVNLHHQCHHLVHFDVPWSFIRIEQRNGRIDRFGQLYGPKFSALLLTSTNEDVKDDRVVSQKLLEKEQEVSKSIGTVADYSGKPSAADEESSLITALLDGGSVQSYIDEIESDKRIFNPWDMLDDEDDNDPAPELHVEQQIFSSTEDFVQTALRGTTVKAQQEGRVYHLEPPPEELRRRLDLLPKAFLQEQKIKERLSVTFDPQVGQQFLDKARKNEDDDWPRIGYASDLHPVVDWLVDKTLAKAGRNEAFVVTGNVSSPTYLIQGQYSNHHGRATVVQWMAVSNLDGQPVVEDMVAVLARAGIGPDMSNSLPSGDIDGLYKLLPTALTAARAHLESVRTVWDAENKGPIAEYKKKVASWEDSALTLFNTDKKKDDAIDTSKRRRGMADGLETTGQPYLRVLAVVEAGQ